MGEITTPTLLTSKHQPGDFDSGNATLDEWLTKRALKNQETGASRTFVICQEESRIIGYYALSTGSIDRNVATSNFSRGMPHPIPVIILGRLAIDQTHQNKKLGSALLKDAILRTLSVSNNAGVRGLLVHAISEKAKGFYLKYGFQESPIEPMTLFVSIKNLKKHFS